MGGTGGTINNIPKMHFCEFPKLQSHNKAKKVEPTVYIESNKKKSINKFILPWQEKLPKILEKKLIH
jgi:hypothetical protein